MNQLRLTKSHRINLDTFGFVEREKVRGITQIYRCGRDFLYYTLHFYNPDTYGPKRIDALALERSGLLGFQMTWFLMWTLLQFVRLPALLTREGLELVINDRIIRSWWSLVYAFVRPQPPTLARVMHEIDTATERQEVVGVDLSLACGGLVDHILFVYGYDEDNVYVFDTHQVPYLPYEKITDDNRFIMKLPTSVLSAHLGRMSRIWKVRTVQIQ